MLSNVDRILYFRDNLTIPQFRTEFGFEPDGINDYYGLTTANTDRVANGGLALGAIGDPFSHAARFGMVLDSLNNSSKSEMTVMLGLEPKQQADDAAGIRATYGFVQDNVPFLQTLAQELAAAQAQVNAGKSLNITVRFASEMNSGDNAYGPKQGQDRAKQIRDYIDTFHLVRSEFRIHAPEVQFSFSPALRADVSLSRIAGYWPGNSYVDVIGGTWYVHGEAQFTSAVQLMHRYFTTYFDTYHKPIGLSEVGGGDDQYRQNDAYLERMCEELENLPTALSYLSLFLNQDRWGQDVTLDFVTS